MNRSEAAKRAIKRAGGPKALADALADDEVSADLMYYRVAKWRQMGVAAKYVVRVERLTGIPRHELYPELFPPDVAA